MKRISNWAFILAALLFTNCSGPTSKGAPFSGTWTSTEENTLLGKTSTETVEVNTDGYRFRVERKNTDDVGNVSTHITVYDGENIHSKYAFTAAANNTEYDSAAMDNEDDEGDNEHSDHDAAMPAEDGETHKPTPGELGELTFWREILDPSLKTGSSETIAGRKANLYQATWKQADGEMSGQVWLDDETDAVLRRVASMYSKQIESQVMKISLECTRFHPGQVDPSLFNRP